MILSALIDDLRQRGQVSLHDLADHLGSSPEALREMLAILERKGKVRRLPAGTACAGGCQRCAPENIELYEWSGQ